MDIQHHDSEHKQQDRVDFQQVYEYDDDLVQQLIVVINSLFSPLRWILQETLYRRIKRQDKGWIDINYLNRNPKIKQIFRQNGVLSQTRRRRNLLLRAIKRSILKKKKNLIKRKELLNVNEQMKKVIYLESKSAQLVIENNETQKIGTQSQGRVNLNGLKKSNLISVVKKITKQLTENSNHDQMKNQQTKSVLIKLKSDSSIEFYGEHNEVGQQTNQNSPLSSKQQHHSLDEKPFRWCFMYLPHIETEMIENVQKLLNKNLNMKFSPEKANLNEQINIINKNQNVSQILSNNLQKVNVKTYSLKKMIELYSPMFDEICKQIGYTKPDVQKQRLRIRRKQKQRERVRLLESVDLEKKIDVVNQYHVKLQVERQRKAYLKNKQAEYQRKMRLREQRKNNKSKNKTEKNQQHRDIFTQKLKQLLGLQNLEDKKQTPKTQEDLKNQQEKDKQQEKKIEENGTEHEKPQQDTKQKASKIQIKLPKYEENIELSKNEIKEDIVDQNNEIYESFFDDQQEIESSEESQDNYELPKKKKQKKKNLPKKKKIVKSNLKESKDVKTIPKQAQIHLSTQRQKTQRNSQKNTAYNLRQKTLVHGSYLKMVESFPNQQDISHIQKAKNDKFSKKFQNVIDDPHGVSNSRSLRSNRKISHQ